MSPENPTTVEREIFLKERAIRQCPSCETEITLEKETMQGDLQVCPGCGLELEIHLGKKSARACLSEIEKYFPDLVGACREILSRDEPPYIFPAPQEEEDWGE